MQSPCEVTAAARDFDLTGGILVKLVCPPQWCALGLRRLRDAWMGLKVPLRAWSKR